MNGAMHTTQSMPGDRPAPNPFGGRSTVLARNGMAATSQPLASAAALHILRDGGNAVDAAICAAAVLGVVEPMMTGIGGDVFAVVQMAGESRPVALNASGWSGSGATLECFRRKGLPGVPATGPLSISVPGAVAGWFALHAKYGRVAMPTLLEPAIAYAEDGFAVSDVIGAQWKRAEDKLRSDPAAAATFLVDGHAPRTGSVFRNPDLAGSMRAIARSGADAFYRGELAGRIARHCATIGALIEAADLSDYVPHWSTPISTIYRGFEVCECGPNTQGATALEMLNIIEAFDLRSLGHNSADYLHLLVEAKKLAFADRDRYLADPGNVPGIDRLISKEYAALRRRSLDMTRAAAAVAPGVIETGDTVYLTVVDGDRNVVSFINSIFFSFGSGITVPGTGIMLQNRGHLFELDPGHPNCVAPRKLPFHTLIPGLVLKAGRPYFSFGVMGGDMQPQGHVQLLANLIDFGMDVQQAGEAARFRHSALGLALESGIGAGVRTELIERGHNVISSVDVFGGFQGIAIDPETGVLHGGSDLRKDGLAVGW